MKLFVRGEGSLGMFQVPLRDPRVFFSRIPLPSDQEGTGKWSSMVVYDLLDFIFLFSIDKIRGRCREVLAMGLVFMIRRQERSMEDWVDLLGLRQAELVNNGE